MSSLILTTDRAEFIAASEQFDVVPVRSVIDSADIKPIDAIRALRTHGEPAFIFESESPEANASRYSYVCPTAEKVIRTGEHELVGDINPISALRSEFETRSVSPVEELPDHVTGAFGFIAYEAIRHFEPSVGQLPEDPTGSPVSAMIFPSELLIFDHALDQIHILLFQYQIANFEVACTRIRQIFQTLVMAQRSEHFSPASPAMDDTPLSATNGQFPEMVRAARRSIIDGELIQVVLGQRVETPTLADPIGIYEQLSTMNPSPYMYMLDLGDMQLIGASPELMLRSTNGKAEVHPIAGTRPRGRTADEDLQYEADLISNEKESAEHVMLVDLARNDLGRVCEPGTVQVKSLKHIERYSHVMHLVSRVEGQLTTDNDGIDAFMAGFPIGTLSGAPKIRSIQLIAELEPEGRGPYCGGIGWFGANGDVDTGTIIRSIVLRDGRAHVQCGAGIVFDSDPEAENLESLQKAKAPLLAITRTEAIQEQSWRNSEHISPKIPHAATILMSGD